MAKHTYSRDAELAIATRWGNDPHPSKRVLRAVATIAREHQAEADEQTEALVAAMRERGMWTRADALALRNELGLQVADLLRARNIRLAEREEAK